MKLLFGVVFLLSMAIMVESMNIMEHRPHLPKQKPPQTPKAKTAFPVETIKTVHVVFMNHLDVGYNGIAPEIGFARNVINRYFDVYYPRAINTSNWLRKMGRSERMIYTTHSWLLDMFFDCPAGMQINCPNQDQQDQVAAAIVRGDIAYHATPFNMQPEFMDESLFEFSFSLTKKLDKRFGKNTTTMSQRDVPGFTRSALKVMKREGVRAVSVGVNCMTPPPGVPSAFVWRDPPSGQSVLALWHPNGYPNNPGPSTSDPGGISVEDCVLVDGLNSTLAFAFRTDNTGPPEVDEVISNFAVLQGEFPKAQIMASTIDNFIDQLETVRDQLPVLDEEIGDSWLMGVPSDPKKVAQFREISRARTECLNAGGKPANQKQADRADRAVQCSIDDPRIQNFSRIFVKLAEHTWGLPGVYDTGNWTNESFEKYRRVELQYVNCTLSWIEQRKYIDWAIEALEDHPLAADLQQRLNDIVPAYPSMDGMEPVNNLSTVFRCPNNVSLGFDGVHGNIIKYFDGKTDWASADFPLGQFIYRSYSGADFDEFAAYYHYLGGPWWYKHNVTENANPKSQPWYPTMLQLWKSSSGCRFITRSGMQPEAYTYYGAPKEVWVEVTVDEKSGDVSVDLTWFGKTTTRLPEGLFFAFTPKPQDNHEWLIEKFGAWISPNEVIVNGSQAQHGTFEGVKYLDTSSSPPSRRHGNVVIDDDESSQLWVKSFDSGVVCPSPFTAFPVVQKIWSQPKGMAFNLYNNIWDTNYILWYPYLDGAEEASSFFRFLIKTT